MEIKKRNSIEVIFWVISLLILISHPLGARGEAFKEGKGFIRNLVGENNGIKTTFSGNKDVIDRSLLRPVSFEKEKSVHAVTSDFVKKNGNEKSMAKSVVNTEKVESVVDKQEITDDTLDSAASKGVESLISFLKSEREKLKELEGQLKSMRSFNKSIGNSKDDLMEDGKKNESDTFFSGNDFMQNGSEMDLNGNHEEMFNGSQTKKIVRAIGTSTVNLTLDHKKRKNNRREMDSTLTQRLTNLVGDIGPLTIAESYYKLGEYNEALKTYKKITPEEASKDQYIWVQFQIANCYRNMKKFELAMNEFQGFVEKYPQDTLAEQAKWYIDDTDWWISWYKKNTVASKQFSSLKDNLDPK
ncbi:MAG: tetratricopeptide repeat protein [Candidatus Brocadiaceae bacterium]|nr:tetratricopeptide repeat protein [Candidatus Brocadiaceae bacterium]